jgi:hypothetical protein
VVLHIFGESSGWLSSPKGDCEMHGFIFFLSPEAYGFSAARRTEASVRSATRNHFARPGAPEVSGEDVALVFTLAAALVINIALFAHYLG